MLVTRSRLTCKVLRVRCTCLLDVQTAAVAVLCCVSCSCAGLVVYATVGLFGSVIVPLYLAHLIEQAAYKRWCLRQMVALATAAAGADGLGSMATLQGSPEPGHTDPAHGDTPGRSASSSNSNSSSYGRSGDSTGLRRRLQRSSGGSVLGSQGASSAGRSIHAPSSAGAASSQQDPFIRAVDAALDATQLPLAGALGPLLKIASAFLRWCMHLLVLGAMLVGTWLLANGLALVVLPRVLSRQQLEHWCPNRPYPPYLIAGQIYEGF